MAGKVQKRYVVMNYESAALFVDGSREYFQCDKQCKYKYVSENFTVKYIKPNCTFLIQPTDQSVI